MVPTVSVNGMSTCLEVFCGTQPSVRPEFDMLANSGVQPSSPEICDPAEPSPEFLDSSPRLMKTLPVLTAALLLTPALHAGTTPCCQVGVCNPCGSGTTVTQWYSAKDGTLREKIPYHAALSRAEDADDLEWELRSVREKLTELRQAAAEQHEAAAVEKDALAAELAALRQQLEQQVAATTAEQERADRAEAAQQAVAAQLEQLQKSSESELSQLRTQLQAADTAREDLAAQVKTLSDERGTLTTQLSTARSELEQLQQEALRNRKVAVVAESEPAEQPNDDN